MGLVKKLVTSIFAILICLPGCAQASGSLEARLRVANDWLAQLCVLERGTFLSLKPDDLATAFVAWEKDTAVVSGCNASSAAPQLQSPQIAVDAKALRLNAWQRIARIGQFQVDIQQTPDYVYGVLQGQPASTPSKFLPDPEHAIISLGGPLYLNELYVGADTRVGVCSALDLKALYAKTPTDPCFSPLYVEAKRTRDNLLRITAAMTLNVNFSQVPKYQSQVILTSLQPFGIPNWTKNVTGSFDPSLLFRTVTEKKALAGYAGQLADALSASGSISGSATAGGPAGSPSNAAPKLFTRNAVVQDLCDSPQATTQNLSQAAFTDTCIKHMIIGGTTQRLVISLLPVVSVKVTSPFDLAKYGTSFIAPPGKASQSLYDVTLTWNLRNVVPSASARLDAFNAASAIVKPAAAPSDPAKQSQDKQAEWKQTVAMMYEELSRVKDRALDDKWWAQFESVVLEKD